MEPVSRKTAAKRRRRHLNEEEGPEYIELFPRKGERH